MTCDQQHGQAGQGVRGRGGGGMSFDMACEQLPSGGVGGGRWGGRSSTGSSWAG